MQIKVNVLKSLANKSYGRIFNANYYAVVL